MRKDEFFIDLQKQYDQMAWKYKYLTGQALPEYNDFQGEAPQHLHLLRQAVEQKKPIATDNIMSAYEKIMQLIHPQDSPPAPDFWQRPIGQLLLQARIIATNDLLMTITQAAKEIKTRPTQLSTWIARGQLPAYDDPTETNPRRRRRVLLSEVIDTAQKMDFKINQ